MMLTKVYDIALPCLLSRLNSSSCEAAIDWRSKKKLLNHAQANIFRQSEKLNVLMSNPIEIIKKCAQRKVQKMLSGKLKFYMKLLICFLHKQKLKLAEIEVKGSTMST